jgi:hypothetical protein
LFAGAAFADAQSARHRHLCVPLRSDRTHGHEASWWRIQSGTDCIAVGRLRKVTRFYCIQVSDSQRPREHVLLCAGLARRGLQCLVFIRCATRSAFPGT